MGWEIAIIASLGSTLGSLWLTRRVLLGLPANYFVAGAPPASGRLAWVGRNVAGILLILLGIVMSVPGIPGQGFLTMIAGLIVVDLPGKHALERRILGHPKVLKLINRVRLKSEIEPLAPPADMNRRSGAPPPAAMR